MEKKQPVNLRRIIVYSMLFIIGLLIIGEFIAFRFFVSRYEDSIHTNTIVITEVLATRLTEGQEAKHEIIHNIDSEMLTIGNIVLQNRTIIDNNYLHYLTEVSSVTDIYWYDTTGTILYDANNEYVGWQAKVGDPIHTFMLSGLDQYIEDIRKSTDEDQFYKFIYLRANDGYFVQVGIEADAIMNQIVAYDYQAQINEFFAEQESILYALVIDTNFIAIADTDLEDRGIDYTGDADYIRAFQEGSIATHWLYPKINQVVLEIVTPIYYENQIVGLLAVGYSRVAFLSMQSFITLFFIITTISLIFVYVLFQITQVINPLRQLNKKITGIDINNIHVIDKPGENNPVSGIYDTINNLTEKIQSSYRKNQELNAELSHLAYFDYLTNLPNRFAFFDVLKTAIEKNQRLAVLYIDLDDFKAYNDTKGHSFGDKLLLAVAKQLQDLVGSQDFAARYGRDEFLMMHYYQNSEDLQSFVTHLRSIFNHSIYVDNQPYIIGYSLGISLFPEDATSAEELVRKADIAMYFVKKTADQSHAYYEPKMDEIIEENARIANQLKIAIKEEGFYMVYQPIVDLHSEEIVSYEALLRLKNSSLSPARFVPIAEQAGLIGAIGQIVLRKVIHQIGEWRKNLHQDIQVSVNFSSKQLDDDHLIDFIASTLKEEDVPPSLLAIEITESAVIERASHVIVILTRMRKMGLKIAIDDFGSGQAGINYLTQFQVDEVKFDKSFVDKYLHEGKMEIFNTLIYLCELLGFNTLAEGIERESQVALLKTTKCQYVQGYYYYRPMDELQIEALIIAKKKQS